MDSRIRRLPSALVRLCLLEAGLWAGLAGCSAPEPPPPVDLDRHLTILPVNNLTGDPLLVAGDGLLDRYVIHPQEVAVGDVLQEECRLGLQERGFEVTEPRNVAAALKGHRPKDLASAIALASLGGFRTPCLYLEIQRWEADVPMHVRSITASVAAMLIDPASGKVIWQVRRGPEPVRTTGDITLESAYVTAARKVALELVSPLHPESPGPR